MIKAFLFEKLKGFDKTVLWMEQVTTLIGSNASGKSNAIEGIQIKQPIGEMDIWSLDEHLASSGHWIRTEK